MGNTLIQNFRTHQSLFILLLISTILRVFIASNIELGNDEVYYWTYVKYPDISHFDHPPMLGYLAQVFTANLSWESELALRLSAIFCGIIGTILIYLIGLELGNKRTAMYAALLFTASLYSSLISAVFLMPDNPLIVFWLWAIYLMIKILKAESEMVRRGYTLTLGVAIGFAIYSKYHAIFLGLGFILTLIFQRPRLLRSISLYWGVLIALLIASPIYFWNAAHDFISFGFHGDRVGLFEKGIRIDYFFSELFGEIFYNNPINVALIIVSLIALRKAKLKIDQPYKSLLINLSWPLIAAVLFVAIFRRTLPHWTGPAYFSLMLIAALYLSQLDLKTSRRWISSALGLIILILTLGILEINYGLIKHRYIERHENDQKVGKYDVTLDLYGWDEFRKAFEDWESKHPSYAGRTLVSQDLYQSAHIDYYLARHRDHKLIVFGDLEDVHKYAWINAERGYLKKGEDVLYITHSRAYKSEEILKPHFEDFELVAQLPIKRGGKLAEYFFVFSAKGYLKTYEFPRIKIGIDSEY